MRYFVRLAYNGENYFGWQIQQSAPTVQAELEKALSVVCRETVRVTGAGRTDTGVHAREYYAHFDLVNLSDGFNISKLVLSLNGVLPSDIRVFDVQRVVDDAHARFSALSRTYKYCIITRPDPFSNGLAWYYPVKLDINIMNEAAAYLTGVSDFSAFAKKGSNVGTHICRLTEAYWVEQDYSLIFTVTSNRFLRNMVRAMVGTLTEIGRGHIPPDKLPQIIDGGDRGNAGVSVPACGLYLERIEYPSELFLYP